MVICQDAVHRISVVFDIASKRLGIPCLAAANQFVGCCSDWRCVVAIIATWYRFLNEDRLKKKSTSRLTRALQVAIDARRRLIVYLQGVHRQLQWVKENSQLLIAIATDITDAEDSLRNLHHWQLEKKRPKMSDISQIEVSYKNIIYYVLQKLQKVFKRCSWKKEWLNMDCGWWWWWWLWKVAFVILFAHI